MKVLVLGAGALGTLYAARLAACGHQVSVMARGARAEAVRRDGLRIRVHGDARIETVRPRVLDNIPLDEPQDVVLVLVRRQHVDQVLPQVAAQPSPVLMMVNTGAGYAQWRAALGARLMVGFPGVIAAFAADGTLEYQRVPGWVQATVVGEPDGSSSARVAQMAQALRAAGFPVKIRADLESWQTTHAAWIAPFMLSAVAAAGDSSRFLETDHLRAWLAATREAAEVVHAAGVRLTPWAFRGLRWLPVRWAATLLRVVVPFSVVKAQLVAAGESTFAEGDALTRDLQALGPVPHLSALRDRARGVFRGNST